MESYRCFSAAYISQGGKYYNDKQSAVTLRAQNVPEFQLVSQLLACATLGVVLKYLLSFGSFRLGGIKLNTDRVESGFDSV